MSFRKPCHMPFRKLMPPFTLTATKSHRSISVRLLFLFCFVFISRSYENRSIPLQERTPLTYVQFIHVIQYPSSSGAAVDDNIFITELNGRIPLFTVQMQRTLTLPNQTDRKGFIQLLNRLFLCRGELKFTGFFSTNACIKMGPVPSTIFPSTGDKSYKILLLYISCDLWAYLISNYVSC